MRVTLTTGAHLLSQMTWPGDIVVVDTFKSKLYKSFPNKIADVTIDKRARVSAVGCKGFSQTILIERRGGGKGPIVHTLQQDCTDEGLQSFIPIVNMMNECNSFSDTCSLSSALMLLSEQ